MPVYLTSLSEMITMPVAVNTEEYIDVWCNTATDAAWKIRVGDVISVLFFKCLNAMYEGECIMFVTICMQHTHGLRDFVIQIRIHLC